MKPCVICNNEGKYKCPTCTSPYCSVACCKTHKEAKCVPPAPPELNPQAEENKITPKKSKRELEQQYKTEDTVPIEKLQLLGSDHDVKRLLENPHLRDVLKEIDSAKNANHIMQKAMLEPLFVEFADACLKLVEENVD